MADILVHSRGIQKMLEQDADHYNQVAAIELILKTCPLHQSDLPSHTTSAKHESLEKYSTSPHP